MDRICSHTHTRACATTSAVKPSTQASFSRHMLNGRSQSPGTLRLLGDYFPHFPYFSDEGTTVKPKVTFCAQARVPAHILWPCSAGEPSHSLSSLSRKNHAEAAKTPSASAAAAWSREGRGAASEAKVAECQPEARLWVRTSVRP